MSRTLELTVPELDCVEEAQQIQGTLSRLAGVAEVQTAVTSRKAIVAYEVDRIAPEAIREAIRGLGMTVTDGPTPAPSPRQSLRGLLGWGFVSVIAVIGLVGIVGERLGLVEALVERIPAWLALAAVLAGGYPIFRNVIRALRNRTVTSHALMTLGILGAIGIRQYAAAAVIVFFMRLADFIEGYTTERSRQAIKELLTLAPQTARRTRRGGARAGGRCCSSRRYCARQARRADPGGRPRARRVRDREPGADHRRVRPHGEGRGGRGVRGLDL